MTTDLANVYILILIRREQEYKTEDEEVRGRHI